MVLENRQGYYDSISKRSSEADSGYLIDFLLEEILARLKQ